MLQHRKLPYCKFKPTSKLPIVTSILLQILPAIPWKIYYNFQLKKNHNKFSKIPSITHGNIHSYQLSLPSIMRNSLQKMYCNKHNLKGKLNSLKASRKYKNMSFHILTHLKQNHCLALKKTMNKQLLPQSNLALLNNQ